MAYDRPAPAAINTALEHTDTTTPRAITIRELYFLHPIKYCASIFSHQVLLRPDNKDARGNLFSFTDVISVLYGYVCNHLPTSIMAIMTTKFSNEHDI